MNTYSKIAEGLAAWLSFERRCGRENLFSEKSLAHPLGDFSSTDSLVVCERRWNIQSSHSYTQEWARSHGLILPWMVPKAFTA